MYFGTNDTTVPTMCVNCSIAIQNCLSCHNHTYCTACKNNSFLLNFNDTLNRTQICLHCSTYILGCYTCSNQTTCLSCIDNGLYLYNAPNQNCVFCSFFIPACSQCTLDGKCTTCQSIQYAISPTFTC